MQVGCHCDSVYRVVIAGTAQVEQMTLMAAMFSASVSLILSSEAARTLQGDREH